MYDRFPGLGVAEIDLSDAGGRVLAAPIAAPEDVPAFSRASMEGYAV